MTRLPTRDALGRLAEVSVRYREAFDEVQGLLAKTELGAIPSWVFAIDRLSLEELAPHGEALVEAETRRRRWRTALQALTELVALDDPGQTRPDSDEVPVAPDTADQADLPRLDRFITVVNFARAGGCIYLNGSFAPVEREEQPDAADTFDLPDHREDGGTGAGD